MQYIPEAMLHFSGENNSTYALPLDRQADRFYKLIKKFVCSEVMEAALRAQKMCDAF